MKQQDKDKDAVDSDATVEVAALKLKDKPGGTPYRQAERPYGYEKPRRRTLDDMRRLSEEIKRARARKPTDSK